MKQFRIGKVLKPHGNKGYLKVSLEKDFVYKYLQKEKIKLKKEEEVEKIIENIKWHKNNLLLKLEGIDSIDNAEKFRNYYIIIDESELTSLEEQSFYYFQLLGCRVFVDHEYLGKVKDIDNFGSSDILLVEKEADKEEVLIPFLKKIIKDIDINNKEIKVKKVKGMQI